MSVLAILAYAAPKFCIRAGARWDACPFSFGVLLLFDGRRQELIVRRDRQVLEHLRRGGHVKAQATDYCGPYYAVGDRRRGSSANEGCGMELWGRCRRRVATTGHRSHLRPAFIQTPGHDRYKGCGVDSSCASSRGGIPTGWTSLCRLRWLGTEEPR